MKIFVTGGTGFLGREVVRQLVAVGHRVVCLVRDPEKGKERLPSTVELQVGDLFDPAGYQEALQNCQAVIHLVGILVEGFGAGFEKVHVEGTRGLIGACSASGVKRFVYMSSLGSREEARSRYHQTKFRAERILRESALDWTIFRPSVIFGPNDQFVNRLARIVRSSPFIPVIGTGSALIQPVSVRDVAGCVCLAVGNPVSKHKIYPLGGPQAYSYEEVFRLIASVLKIKKKVVHVPAPILYPVAQVSNWVLRNPPITPEQLTMIQEDNVCDSNEAIVDFRLEFQSFERGIKEYLKN